jgi:hypothetical protein
MRTLTGIVFLLVAIVVCGCVSPVMTADTIDNLTMQTSSHHDLAANQHSVIKMIIKSYTSMIAATKVVFFRVDSRHVHFRFPIQTLGLHHPERTKTSVLLVLKTTSTVNEACSDILFRLTGLMASANLFHLRDAVILLSFNRCRLDVCSPCLCVRPVCMDLVALLHSLPTTMNTLGNINHEHSPYSPLIPLAFTNQTQTLYLIFFMIVCAGFLAINMLFGAFAVPCCQRRRCISAICQRVAIPNLIHSSPAYKPSIAWAVADFFAHVTTDWSVNHRALSRFQLSPNASILMMVLCLFASPVAIAKHCEQVALASDRSEFAAASLPSGLVFFAGGFTGAAVLVFG